MLHMLACMPHAIKHYLIGEKTMGKLIMKNGKLVREQEIKIDTELTNPNLSNTAKPLIPKAEVQAKIVTEQQPQPLVQPMQQQPQPVVSNNPEVEKQRLMQQQIEMLQKQLADQLREQEIARRTAVYEEEVQVQKPALEPDYDEDAVNEILQQAQANNTQTQQQTQMQQHYIQQQQQFLHEQAQQELLQQQQQQNSDDADVKSTIKFHFILRSGVDRVFEIPEDEFEKFYNYINDCLITKPVIILENVIMPVMAIDMVYYQ